MKKLLFIFSACILTPFGLLRAAEDRTFDDTLTEISTLAPQMGREEVDELLALEKEVRETYRAIVLKRSFQGKILYGESCQFAGSGIPLPLAHFKAGAQSFIDTNQEQGAFSPETPLFFIGDNDVSQGGLDYEKYYNDLLAFYQGRIKAALERKTTYKNFATKVELSLLQSIKDEETIVNKYTDCFNREGADPLAKLESTATNLCEKMVEITTSNCHEENGAQVCEKQSIKEFPETCSVKDAIPGLRALLVEYAVAYTDKPGPSTERNKIFLGLEESILNASDYRPSSLAHPDFRGYVDQVSATQQCIGELINLRKKFAASCSDSFNMAKVKVFVEKQKLAVSEAQNIEADAKRDDQKIGQSLERIDYFQIIKGELATSVNLEQAFIDLVLRRMKFINDFKKDTADKIAGITEKAGVGTETQANTEEITTEEAKKVDNAIVATSAVATPTVGQSTISDIAAHAPSQGILSESQNLESSQEEITIEGQKPNEFSPNESASAGITALGGDSASTNSGEIHTTGTSSLSSATAGHSSERAIKATGHGGLSPGTISPEKIAQLKGALLAQSSMLKQATSGATSSHTDSQSIGTKSLATNTSAGPLSSAGSYRRNSSEAKKITATNSYTRPKDVTPISGKAPSTPMPSFAKKGGTSGQDTEQNRDGQKNENVQLQSFVSGSAFEKIIETPLVFKAISERYYEIITKDRLKMRDF